MISTRKTHQTALLDSVMSFETCINELKEELNLKYPTARKGKRKVNEELRRLALIDKIQLIVWKVMKNIANGRSPAFRSVVHSNWKNCVFDGRSPFRIWIKFKESKTKLINFKRRSGLEEFTTIVYLLGKTHKLLMMQQTCNRRQLYYENLHLFKCQEQVDRGMREICYLLKASPWELRVSATSHGIVAGPLVLTLPGGQLLDCGKSGGVPVPPDVRQIEKMYSTATWALIVEKDTCFQRLMSTRAANTTLDSCILITGKGFPDVNTRILVCKVWEFLRIPILALVDADPYGFEIMCVYRFGSQAMSPHSEHLACPAVRWLGVHPCDIRPLLLESEALSRDDRRKLQLLLKRRYVEADENLKAQLEILLEGNAKAEIEGVAGISRDYLTAVYVNNKIQCKEYF